MLLNGFSIVISTLSTFSSRLKTSFHISDCFLHEACILIVWLLGAITWSPNICCCRSAWSRENVSLGARTPLESCLGVSGASSKYCSVNLTIISLQFPTLKCIIIVRRTWSKWLVSWRYNNNIKLYLPITWLSFCLALRRGNCSW